MEIEVTQKRRPRRAWRILTSALSLVATLLGLAFIVPSFFGLQRFVITGESMTGTIDLGSIAFEEVVPVSELEVGDIITYQPPPDSGIEHLVTHRIVAIHGQTFRTKGDAVPEKDPWRFQLAQTEQPRVVFAVPYAGWPFIWLSDRGTRMLVIGLPAGLITLYSGLQVVRVLRHRKDDDPRPGRDDDASGAPPELEGPPGARPLDPSVSATG
jgi:signal peptidase